MSDEAPLTTSEAPRGGDFFSWPPATLPVVPLATPTHGGKRFVSLTNMSRLGDGQLVVSTRKVVFSWYLAVLYYVVTRFLSSSVSDLALPTKTETRVSYSRCVDHG